MKLVTAIILVLSQVSLRSCRTRHSVSLMRDENSSEITLVSPHKVPTLTQLIPILEGIDPPEAKISKLKKLIPIYDELNRWRLNNKKRLVEIVPYKKKSKPLAFILPGSNHYANKFKKPIGSRGNPDKASSESGTSDSKINIEANNKHTKHNALAEQPTHDTKVVLLSKNKHKTHSSHKHKTHKPHSSRSHNTDTMTSHAALNANEDVSNSGEINNSLKNTVHHTKYYPESPEVYSSDLKSAQFDSSSNISDSESTESSESVSNVSESNESDFGSSVHDSELESEPASNAQDLESDFDTNVQNSESSEIDSGSNIQDLEPSEPDSGLNVRDSESSESDPGSNVQDSESNQSESVSSVQDSESESGSYVQNSESNEFESAPNVQYLESSASDSNSTIQDSEYNKSESASNIQDSVPSESELASNDQNLGSDFNSVTSVEKAESNSGSNVQDSGFNKSVSVLNVRDSDSGDTDSGYSSLNSNLVEETSGSNTKISKAFTDSESQEPKLDSKSSERDLESTLSYIDLETVESELESSLTSDSKSGSYNKSGTYDNYNSVFNKSYLPEYDSNSNSDSSPRSSESNLESSDSVPTSAVILSDKSRSESDENSELNDSVSELELTESDFNPNWESRQSNLDSSEGFEKAATHHVKKYGHHTDSNEPYELAIGTTGFSTDDDYDDHELIVDTTLLGDQSNENDDSESNEYDDSGETYDPVAQKHMVNKLHKKHDGKEIFVLANTTLAKKPHENQDESSNSGVSNNIESNDDEEVDPGDESNEAAEPDVTGHITKKHHATTSHTDNKHHKHDRGDESEEVVAYLPVTKNHQVHGELKNYDSLAYTKRLAHKHHENDDNASGNAVVSSKHIGKYHGNDVDDYDEVRVIGNWPMANKRHKEDEVGSDETDEPVVAITSAYKHHENNDNESNADELRDDSESNNSDESNETDKSVAARHVINKHNRNYYEDELIKQIAKTLYEKDVSKYNNGEQSLDKSDNGESKEAHKPLGTRRMIIEQLVKFNSHSDKSSELCNELPKPALREPGSKLRRQKKKYVLSFVFNR